jgi:cysteine desulfurase
MVAANKASVTYIEPTAYGNILPKMVEGVIKSNTALISVMYVNNELGTINDVKGIGKVAHKHKIPFHTDAVQAFGKFHINVEANNIDAMSASFHKLSGPMGIGMLIIKNELIEGYNLQGQISGTQQQSLRGGTQNVPAIAGIIPAMIYTFDKRESKNKKLQKHKDYILSELTKNFQRGYYKNYFSKTPPTTNEFLLLGPASSTAAIPNTLLLSFAKNARASKQFCNGKLKKHLAKNKVIVSVGSACSTSDAKASHVLYAIKAPPVIRQGVLRVSMSGTTTKSDVDSFIKHVTAAVQKQFA